MSHPSTASALDTATNELDSADDKIGNQSSVPSAGGA